MQVSTTGRFQLGLIFLTLLSHVIATPQIGIQLDPLPVDKNGKRLPYESVQSYSAIIEFQDKAIPVDKTKMSDRQLLQLTKVAYDEMVALWKDKGLINDACPGALGAFESDGRIYFASSVRALPKIQWGLLDAEIKDSIGWFFQTCMDEDMGPHRLGGKCAEPNLLRLYGEYNTPPGGTEYTKPPTTNSSPRLAVWGRPSPKTPTDGAEQMFPPCKDGTEGWGCIRMVPAYGLKSIPDKKTPVVDGQDDWRFTVMDNPRC